MNNLIFFVNKTDSMDIGTGAIYSIVAIIMVFAILLVIIGIMELIFKLTNVINLKKETNNATIITSNENVSQSINHEVVIEDDDMMAACLVASIDYRNETKKDVKVVSIKKL